MRRAHGTCIVTVRGGAPPAGTFNRSAAEIARTMARKDVSPKGPGSGIRMIQYFINRGGTKRRWPRRRYIIEVGTPVHIPEELDLDAGAAWLVSERWSSTSESGGAEKKALYEGPFAHDARRWLVGSQTEVAWMP